MSTRLSPASRPTEAGEAVFLVDDLEDQHWPEKRQSTSNGILLAQKAIDSRILCKLNDALG